jgi:hypothetical protein
MMANKLTKTPNFMIFNSHLNTWFDTCTSDIIQYLQVWCHFTLIISYYLQVWCHFTLIISLFTGMMPLHTHNLILFTGMMLSIATSQPQSHPIKVTNSEGETVQILTTDGHGNLISGGTCTCQIHVKLFLIWYCFNNGKILTCPL